MSNVKSIVSNCKSGCDHEYQDAKYGKGMRLHNKTKDGERCSVCGNGGHARDRIFTSPSGRYTLDTTAYDKAFPRRK